MEDIKKNILNEEENADKVLLVVTYNSLGRVFAFLFYLMGIGFGSLFLVYSKDYYTESNQIGFTVILFFILGILFVYLGFKNILQVTNFKKLVFYNNRVSYYKKFFIKNNYEEIKYDELNDVSLTHGRLAGGSLDFGMLKPFGEKTISFEIDILPIKRETLKDIKNILVDKKVLKGDEIVWNL